ncbi:MAG: hypothetical protein LC794_04565 [Acidobacteria bacterium]|nr:hypothetical protein [Acidobacteriota bacterium]
MLEAENWKIVFGEGHPILALTLAYQLIALKQSLQPERKGIPEAIAGLDLAIDSLYPHTDFYKVSHRLFSADNWRELSSLSKKKNSGSLALKAAAI